ncbi:hypothetical protein PspLS_07542 [Pyricularia sp. CBS 133598]|nr:hypothetical protein PspLS_07542 [Pyricularia sp. CBS 133598]
MRLSTIPLTMALWAIGTAAVPTPTNPPDATHAGKPETYDVLQPRGEAMGLKAGANNIGSDQLPGDEYRSQGQNSYGKLQDQTNDAKAAKLVARSLPVLKYTAGSPLAQRLSRDKSLDTVTVGENILFWRPKGRTFQGEGNDDYGELASLVKKEREATRSANIAKQKAIAEDVAFILEQAEPRRKNRELRSWGFNQKPAY